jgi:multidrug efflux pump
MGGIIERLFREFSITIVAAILISLGVSLTLTPMLCSRWLKPHGQSGPKNIFQRISDGFHRWLVLGYDKTLGWALRHAPLVVCLLLGVIALNVSLYVKAPKSFLPMQDTGQLGGFIRGDDGLSFQVMQPKIEQYRRAVLEDPAVESMAGFIGGGGGINNAQTFVRLKPLAERKVSAEEVVQRINMKLPKVPGARMRLFVDQDLRFGGGGRGGPGGGGGGGGYEYTLLADDTQLLRTWAGRVKKAIEELPQLTGFDDELISSQQVTLAVDRAEARRLGVEMNTVTQTLNNAFGQRQVSTIYNALNQYRVVMEVSPEYARGPEALDELYVIANGQRVPLSAFSTYSHTAADDRVSHSGQFASQTISFELKPGVSMSEATDAIDQAVARLAMPSSVQGRIQGNAAFFQQMQNSQGLAVLGTLLIVYIVLGVLYESYMHPLTILSTLPSAGVGALLALQMLKTDFSLIAMLGVFLLVGVVMKNAILMIDVALQLEREKDLSPYDSIREACLLRLRPILMTTMAAMLGAVPLMLNLGEGSEMRKPLGIAIVGGLIFSQVLTLYTTPVVYLYLDRLRHWASRRKRAAQPAHA